MRGERKAIYVQCGVPAVTDAEIEIMRLHLQQCAADLSSAALNDI